MQKPPPKRGSRPPQRESRPKEQNVYRHPDAQAQVPERPASPWQRSTSSTPAKAPYARGERERPSGAPSAGDRPRPASPYGRDERARSDQPRPAAPYARGPRPESARPRDESASSRTPPVAIAAESLATPVDERDGQRRREVRIYGRAACLALADDRFEGIRKLYCTRQRARELAPLLARLAAARVGFNEVDDEDLARLTASQHHEGVACDILRREQPTLAELQAALAQLTGPVSVVALAGVGNPHNFGAILRSAVHFGARAVLIPDDSTLTLAGAVYRVAEGAAERVPVVRFASLEALHMPGFEVIATSSQGERSLYRDVLPERSVLLFGAEGAGLDRAALASADARYAIPGSGRVDSLNVGQAVAVVLGEWWRGARIAAGD
jgi:RNA methyltransferase, TrmH family